jgi:hypothetical protein
MGKRISKDSQVEPFVMGTLSLSNDGKELDFSTGCSRRLITNPPKLLKIAEKYAYDFEDKESQ